MPTRDDQRQDRELQQHHRVVGDRRLAGAEPERARGEEHDRHRRQVDDPGVVAERGGDEGVREVDPEGVEQADEVARPADRDGRGGEQVLEQQVPADEPADEGAEGGEGVGVGAAGGRDHRGQLRVTEGGQPGDDAGEDEGDQDGRPRVVGGGVAGDDEDPGADDAGDAEQGEAEGAERVRVEPGAVVFARSRGSRRGCRDPGRGRSCGG